MKHNPQSTTMQGHSLPLSAQTIEEEARMNAKILQLCVPLNKRTIAITAGKHTSVGNGGGINMVKTCLLDRYLPR